MHPDEQTVAAMAREIRDKEAAPMEIVFHPLTLVQLTGLVQLALRHPDLSTELRATAERFLVGVREYFRDAPTVLDVIRRGDDPAQDISPDVHILHAGRSLCGRTGTPNQWSANERWVGNGGRR